LQVFIAKDACDSSVLLNILLTILGWIPGQLDCLFAAMCYVV